MKILLVDNYDSFVYNIYQCVSSMGANVSVLRNDALTVKDVFKMAPDRIMISPGPGNPQSKADFGICEKLIKRFCESIPMLGICLGHQGIVSAFGGRIIKAHKPMHAKTSCIEHDGSGIFMGVKSPFTAMRYHSLIADESVLPSVLQVTARSMDDGAIMAISHKRYPVFGVQFHPESIMTRCGMKIFSNFLGGDYAV